MCRNDCQVSAVWAGVLCILLGAGRKALQGSGLMDKVRGYHARNVKVVVSFEFVVLSWMGETKWRGNEGLDMKMAGR